MEEKFKEIITILREIQADLEKIRKLDMKPDSHYWRSPYFRPWDTTTSDASYPYWSR